MIASPRAQRGIALLILLSLLLVGIGFVAVRMLTRIDQKARQDEETMRALVVAKQALIAYAVSYSETKSTSSSEKVPGYLPCPWPALGFTEGEAEGVCASQDGSQLGRLPWRTLGIGALKDGVGECLWYAVSGTFKNNPATGLMNWDTPGQFIIKGQDGSIVLAGASADDRAVAVVFAPGRPLGTQDRSRVGGGTLCRGNGVPGNYLESAFGINNASIALPRRALTTFVAAKPTATFNDRLVFITAREIFDHVHRQRVFRERLGNMLAWAAECMRRFGLASPNLRVAWAAPIDLGVLENYYANNNYDDATTPTPLSGRLPYRIDDSLESPAKTDEEWQDYCPAWSDPNDAQRYREWYKNWKDHLFYVVGKDYKPDAMRPAEGITISCSNSVTTQPYAAALIFAGRALPGQARMVVRANIANYLEGANASNHPNTAGNSTYVGNVTTAMNDELFCITQDFTSVQRHPPNLFGTP